MTFFKNVAHSIESYINSTKWMPFFILLLSLIFFSSICHDYAALTLLRKIKTDTNSRILIMKMMLVNFFEYVKEFASLSTQNEFNSCSLHFNFAKHKDAAVGNIAQQLHLFLW